MKQTPGSPIRHWETRLAGFVSKQAITELDIVRMSGLQRGNTLPAKVFG
jgi:hypothetical protein